MTTETTRRRTGPYDRLAEIERRARAGQKISDTREVHVNIGRMEPRPKPGEKGLRPPSSYGQLIADMLVRAPDPMSVQVPAYNITDAEIAATQMAGTRWCAYLKLPRLRLAYRRTGTQSVVFYLAQKKAS